MRAARYRFLPVAALFVAVSLAAACSSGGAQGNDDILIVTRAASGTPAPSGNASPVATASGPAASATPTPDPASVDPRTYGFIFPIEGACLPSSDALMPNAARDYRAGVHEGVDFYAVDNCVPITKGTPVVAVADGVVIRADVDYHDLTWEELDALNRRVANGGANDPDVLDAFRGRQVWIRHDNGIVTRYAHLSGVADGIIAGVRVLQGEVIGYVGESGTPESLTAPGTEYHLHFEIRVGDGFLGEGLPPDQVRVLYQQAFAR
ncbi:MAG TPA: M23 family metallopeptidase [Dehalococcoidia bacterium]|nr:M23 family metallopeptidase [Dehalococcoidia bacterium]